MNKLLQNEKIFQNRNKRLAESTSRLTPEDFPDDFVMEFYCECANKACQEKIAIAHKEYAGIAESPLTFAVKPQHFLPEFEQLKQQNANYWVIMKKPEKIDKPFEV